MPYKNIPYPQTSHPVLNRVFRNADLYLSDVYGMFDLPLKGSDHGAACNFAIVLVLLCVLDGIARDVYPTLIFGEQEKRFKKLIKDRLYWGPQAEGWIDKAEAAALLYSEFRNPLVHELAQNRVSKTRRTGFGEPVIGKWGRVPDRYRNASRIEAFARWNTAWPTIYVQTRGARKMMKLSAAALYWSVKALTNNLASDAQELEFAEISQQGIRRLALSI
jgi:hypothetical protein